MRAIDGDALIKAIDDYERLSAVSQTVRNMTSLREIVQQLLSAQPETHEKRTGTHACDCIERQAAIEVIDAVFPVDPMKSEYAQGIACGAALAKTYVEQLPSAQPQIIHCTDCRHWKHSDVRKNYCEVFDWMNTAEDFCSFAERRSDE